MRKSSPKGSQKSAKVGCKNVKPKKLCKPKLNAKSKRKKPVPSSSSGGESTTLPPRTRSPRTPARMHLSPAAQEELIKANVALARWYVNERGHHHPALDRDQIFSCAMEGLMHAARRFDPDRRTAAGTPVKFATVAVWWIRSKVQHFDRAERKRGFKCGPMIADRPSTMHSSGFNFDGSPLADRVSDGEKTSGQRSDAHGRYWSDEQWSEVVRTLDPRGRALLTYYFRDNLTLAEVAKLIPRCDGSTGEITRERVRQLIRRALQQLRKRAGFATRDQLLDRLADVGPMYHHEADE